MQLAQYRTCVLG